MDDKHIENVPMETLEGMTQPENYLFSEEEPPSLENVSEKGLGLRRITKKSRDKTIPTKGKDPYAKQDQPLNAIQIAALQNAVRSQPILYEEIRKVHRKSEISSTFGAIIGLLTMMFYLILDKFHYYKNLTDLPAAHLPSWIPNSLEKVINNVNWPEGLGDIVAISAGALLPILLFLSVAMFSTEVLRFALLRRVNAIFPAVFAGCAALYTYLQLGAKHPHPLGTIVIVIVLLLVAKIGRAIGGLFERVIR